jgi:anti-sigma-K factor RskA
MERNDTMNCEEFEELSGAYALNAVTPAERLEAKAHLAECPACTRRLKELRSVVALLPLSVTQVTPSASLKARIMAALEQERKATLEAQAVPQRLKRPRRQGWGIRLLAAAAVLMFALLGGMAAWNVSLANQTSALRNQVSLLQSERAATYAIVGDQSAQGATGKLIYLPQQHLTVIIIHGLPQLKGTQVYQGWLLQGKQPMSIGLLSVQNGIASIDYLGDITGYSAAAVSIEKGPNATQNAPAGPVVASGMLAHPSS